MYFDVSPSHGWSLGENGYKDLSSEKDVPIRGGSLRFANSLSSIEEEQEVSFFYLEEGSPPEEFSIKIGRNTPLFSQIQQIPKENQAKRSAAIKALLVKYTTALLNVDGVSREEFSEISATFEKNQCQSISLKEERVVRDLSKEPEENFQKIHSAKDKQKLSYLASSQKLKKTVSKALFPKQIYKAKREIQNQIGERKGLSVKVKDDFYNLQTSTNKENIQKYKRRILSKISQFDEKKPPPKEVSRQPFVDPESKIQISTRPKKTSSRPLDPVPQKIPSPNSTMKISSSEEFKNKLEQGQTDFSGMTLENISVHQLRMNHLKDLSFEGTIFKNCSFDDAIFTNVDFKNAKLSKMRFVGSTLENTSFEKANIKGCSFGGSVLNRVNFDNATLNGEGDDITTWTGFCPEKSTNVSFKNTSLNKVQMNVSAANYSGIENMKNTRIGKVFSTKKHAQEIKTFLEKNTGKILKDTPDAQQNSIFSPQKRKKEPLPRPIQEPVNEEPQQPPEDEQVLSNAVNKNVLDATGKEKQGDLQLPTGIHKIKILHGSKKGQTVDLQTDAPIYRFANAQIGRMPAPSNCLLMQKNDFNRIESMIHPGAFGGDYSDTGDGWVVVWKLPADLKEIKGWKTPMEPASNSVGKYHMADDTSTFSKNAPLPGNNTGNISATKFRMDLPSPSPSVHHLKLPDESQVAAFSTGNLFQDFYRPTTDEKQKTDILLQELNKAGIKAFMCNSQHHLLVLYKNGRDQKMTPRDVADMLQQPNGNAIKAAFQKAGKADFDAEEWSKSFIHIYGEGPKGAEVALPRKRHPPHNHIHMLDTNAAKMTGGLEIVRKGDLTKPNELGLTKNSMIVNAANTGFAGGGGVDGAIGSAYGGEIYRECGANKNLPNGENKHFPKEGGVGGAIFSRAGTKKEQIQGILHSVAPIKGSKNDTYKDLKNSYLSPLIIAFERWKSLHQPTDIIAFTTMGTGVFGWNPQESADALKEAIHEMVNLGDQEKEFMKQLKIKVTIFEGSTQRGASPNALESAFKNIR